jgi:ABC-type enterobactin transport system permease subunit
MDMAAHLLRLSIALVIGGIVSATFLSAASMLVMDTEPLGLRAMPENFLWYAPFFMMVAVVAALVVGAPSFFLLRHFRLLNWISVLCIGAGLGLIGAIVMFGTRNGFGAPFTTGRAVLSAAAGAIGALVAYWVLLRSKNAMDSDTVRSALRAAHEAHRRER